MNTKKICIREYMAFFCMAGSQILYFNLRYFLYFVYDDRLYNLIAESNFGL